MRGDRAARHTMRRPKRVAMCAATSFVLLTITSFGQGSATMRPVVSEDASPIQAIAPRAQDGFVGEALLRKPAGDGPFPAVILIHGGMTRRATDVIRTYMTESPQPSRFLAAGYVVSVLTYRSRDHDPQSRASFLDVLAVVEHVRRLPYVDASSIGVFGCSGGGDLALEVAAATDVAAIAAEEPATVLFTGIFTINSPKSGERHTPADAQPILVDGRRHYTAEHQALTREKISRIAAPILILQGDQLNPSNGNCPNCFNADVFIPELRAAEKAFRIQTYPGELHCFAFNGMGPSTPHPSAALQAFEDIDRFFRPYLKSQPRAISEDAVRHIRVARD